MGPGRAVCSSAVLHVLAIRARLGRSRPGRAGQQGTAQELPYYPCITFDLMQVVLVPMTSNQL